MMAVLWSSLDLKERLVFYPCVRTLIFKPSLVVASMTDIDPRKQTCVILLCKLSYLNHLINLRQVFHCSSIRVGMPFICNTKMYDLHGRCNHLLASYIIICWEWYTHLSWRNILKQFLTSELTRWVLWDVIVLDLYAKLLRHCV